jgi:hypothetical protein
VKVTGGCRLLFQGLIAHIVHHPLLLLFFFSSLFLHPSLPELFDRILQIVLLFVQSEHLHHHHLRGVFYFKLFHTFAKKPNESLLVDCVGQKVFFL